MAARGSLCLPHVRQTLAGSTKVLERDEEAKKPPECAVVASAVAFMGPKWRRPPVFYFSSMMAADAVALATDSSLSVHPASIAACMARPQAWEAPTDMGGAVRRGSDDARAAVLTVVPAWSKSPLLIELNWSDELLNHVPTWAATGSVGPSEVGEAPSGLARIRRARRATQPAWMRDNYSS